MRLLPLTLTLALSATSALAVSGTGYRVCNLDPYGDNFLALRTGPSSSSPMVMKLGPGTIVEDRGAQHGKWLPVAVIHANGRDYLRDLPNGYVFTDYLCNY